MGNSQGMIDTWETDKMW